MGRGCEKPKFCVKCGMVLKAKRLATKAYILEIQAHEGSGECFRRKMKQRAAQAELKQATGCAQAAIDNATAPIYELLAGLRSDLSELKGRVERRLESRKRQATYKERDAKPKPWVMTRAVESIPEDAHPIQSFRDIMTKDYETGWSWERALTQWFHWLLDQCSSDPIILMARDEIRYHTKAGPVKTTKLRFFRCFASKMRGKWDPADETNDAFFIGFWYPLVRACRSMVHWENWIMFNLPITEQAKRHVESIWHDDMMDPRTPCLQRDSRIARVFYDVLVERKDMRRQARMEDEKEQP